MFALLDLFKFRDLFGILGDLFKFEFIFNFEFNYSKCYSILPHCEKIDSKFKFVRKFDNLKLKKVKDELLKNWRTTKC